MKSLQQYISEDRIRSVKGSVSVGKSFKVHKYSGYLSGNVTYPELEEISSHIWHDDKNFNGSILLYDSDENNKYLGRIDLVRKGNRLYYNVYDDNGHNFLKGDDEISSDYTVWKTLYGLSRDIY